MAHENRPATHAVELLQDLEREPYRFDFYEALRRLECLYHDKPRLGRGLRAADEPVRLAQEPHLTFAPANLAAFQPGEAGRPSRLLVRFLGLLGPNGALPLHLTEYARDRLRNSHDPTVVRFLDIFHHRMLALFYRAWADAEPTVHFDRPTADRFAVYVSSLCGQGLPALRDRDAFPDSAKRFHAGTFACQTRHPEGLAAVMAAFLRLPVRLIEFLGRWIDLPSDSVCQLGESTVTGVLGESIIVGERVWDCTQTFEIAIGPLNLLQYVRLLPGGASLERLTAIVRDYLGDELAWQLRLTLKKNEIPPLQLGESGQLGWTTWLACATRDDDADDLVLQPLPELN